MAKLKSQGKITAKQYSDAFNDIWNWKPEMKTK